LGQTKKQKGNSQILRRILLIICGAILGMNIYYLNSANLIHNNLPMPFGYGAAVVLSGSMEPELSAGDLIFVKEAATVKTGDIVVFQEASILVVHRIIDVDGDVITTKGDANSVADQPIDRSVIKGKVMFAVPYVGTLVNILKTPFGVIFIIAAAILLLELPRRYEKKKDDEEKQRIIEEIRRLKDEADKK